MSSVEGTGSGAGHNVVQFDVLLMIRNLTLAKLQGFMEILKNSLGVKPRCIVTSWV